MAALRSLRGQVWLDDERTQAVLAALANDGTPIRFVGGCVRDGLLGLADLDTDLDLTGPLRPEQVMRRLQDAGIRALPTGMAHGTITAVVGGKPFEITTLRRDVETHGRHATVVFTDSFEQDALRRDFTINALSADPDGTVHDYVGGLDDLDAGRVAFIGDPNQRIEEDYLRILRFFRFTARFAKGTPNLAGLEACAVHKEGLARLSGERIWSELKRLLAVSRPLGAMRGMVSTGVFGEIVPGEVDLGSFERLLTCPRGNDVILRLGALMPPDVAALEALADRLRLSKAEHGRLACMLRRVDAAAFTDARTFRQVLYDRGAQGASDSALLAFARGDITAAILAERLTQAECWRAPALPLTGGDLRALGMASGPAMGAMLRSIEAWWRAQDFAPDREACLAEAGRRLAPRAGASSGEPADDGARSA